MQIRRENPLRVSTGLPPDCDATAAIRNVRLTPIVLKNLQIEQLRKSGAGGHGVV
jgi:hypothetical protein